MATEPIDSLSAEIKRKGLRIGNEVLATTDLPTTASALPYVNSTSKLAATAVTASTPVYIDSSSVPQTGNIPFAFPLAAGATNTGFSSMAITGSATGSVDELMHLNLVKGSNATSTIAGFVRITVTDNAGVITDGAYYMPFYTLN